MVRFGAAMETTFPALTFAQRARCAAAIRARPAADTPAPRDDPFAFSAASALLRFCS